MSNLSVVEKDGALVVDSRLIAEKLGTHHSDWFQNIVLRYQTQAEQAFGFLRFENGEIKGRGRPEKIAFLTEDQATFYMTLSRNTPEVVECKIALVKAFSEAKRQLQPPALVPQFSRLDRLEMEIQEGIELMEAGKARIWQAAATIHAEQLWKERGFQSFAEYCHIRWGWRKSNAWEIARAGKVTVQLQQAGVKPEELPTAVAQIRPLLKLEPEAIPDIWQELVEATQNEITAATVETAVRQRLSEPEANDLAEIRSTVEECRILFRRAIAAINRLDTHNTRNYLAAAHSRLGELFDRVGGAA